MKVGQLVRFEHPETLTIVFGTVTDILEAEDGWPMCEVICTNPLSRFWMEDLKLTLIKDHDDNRSM